MCGKEAEAGLKSGIAIASWNLMEIGALFSTFPGIRKRHGEPLLFTLIGFPPYVMYTVDEPYSMYAVDKRYVMYTVVILYGFISLPPNVRVVLHQAECFGGSGIFRPNACVEKS